MADEKKQINDDEIEVSTYSTGSGPTLSKVEVLKRQAEEYLNGWKRAKADYLNLKKEMDSQNKEIKSWLSKVMLLPFLEIMDSFDKAALEIPENIKNESWTSGILNIKKQFEEYLKNQKVESMKVSGENFDPLKHEAIDSVAPADGNESGTVVEELQKGYLIDGEVLRPAKVKVYK